MRLKRLTITKRRDTNGHYREFCRVAVHLLRRRLRRA